MMEWCTGWIARCVALVLVGLACAPQAPSRDPATLPAAGEHAIYSEQLTERMRALDALTRERLPQALDVRAALAPRIGEVADACRAIARSADAIAEAAEQLDLTASERTQFVALAGTLRQRALRLAERAPELSTDALRGEVERIEATCDRCHARFRIPR